MKLTAPLSELGQFVVTFQAIEAHLTEVIVLFTGADDEHVHALVAELEYNSRLRAADVIFARFVGLTRGADTSAPLAFHKLMSDLQKLGERRNSLIHSHYNILVGSAGALGLARRNRKLRPSKGIQEHEAEDLMQNSLSEDLRRLGDALARLEQFRLKAIEWKYPT